MNMLKSKCHTKFILLCHKSVRYYLGKNAGFIFACFCDDENFVWQQGKLRVFQCVASFGVTHFFMPFCVYRKQNVNTQICAKGIWLMVFSSTVFLFLFLPALLLLYYFPGIESRTWKNTVLLLFSIGFYAWGEPIFVFIMLISVLINWWLGLRIENEEIHRKRKAWLTAAIVLDVALLAVFKYASFISESIASLFGNNSLILNIALPIGISFFTFQMMSYVFDVYYKTASAQKNPFYVALYITLFPQLIAGPIVRYNEVEHDILYRQESFGEVAEGVKRFIYGLGKKVLIANYMAQIADNVFDNPSMHTVSIVWLGAIAYTLQIYYDFSGYSDMAIGLGKMFGFHFSENFRYPYTAGRITEYWQRWHISLTTWFRDYVYIPLGGSRVKRSKWIRNLFIVWALTGIWHGADWTFLLCGLGWFACLLTEKLTGLADKRSTVLSHVYTMLIIILAWVIFRSDSVASGIRYMGEMFGIGCGFGWNAAWEILRRTWLVLLLAVIGIFPIIPKFRNSTAAEKLPWLENAFLIVVFISSILQIVSDMYNPFIYFNF